MEPKQDLLNRCLGHLNTLPHICATLAESQDGEVANGANQLTIQSPLQVSHYFCVTQSKVTSKALGMIVHQLKHLESNHAVQSLLFAWHLSESAIDQMIEHNLEFVDTAGNIYLSSPAA